jgi:hypothetical protein
VNPRAASGGGACRGRAATVPGVHGFTETFPANLGFFRGCFFVCNFQSVM